MSRAHWPLLIALLAGCGLDIDNGQLTCSTSMTCPDGYYCAFDDHCWQTGTAPSLDFAIAPIPDLGTEIHSDLSVVVIRDLTTEVPSDLTAVATKDLTSEAPDDLTSEVTIDLATQAPSDLATQAPNDLASAPRDLGGDLATCPGDCANPDHCQTNNDCANRDAGGAICNLDAALCVQCSVDGDCPAGQLCKSSACVPGCTAQHACPQLPHLTVSCTNGACVPGACAPGYSDCDQQLADGCESATNSDAKNCGSCGIACSIDNDTPTCVAGACVLACTTGYGDCNHSAADGCEVHLAADTNNCGGCGVSCSFNNITAMCGGGSCDGPCASGYADCDGNKQTNGCEVNTTNDVANCGGCGTTCSANDMLTISCSGGACNGSCDFGFADCDGDKRGNGCETSTNSVLDCGPGGLTNGGRGAAAGCGAICSTQNGTPSCGAGACAITCNAGFANCDNVVGNTGLASNGCETATLSDPNNCGAGGGTGSAAPGCGVVCSASNMQTRLCTGGTCNGDCAAGFADCDSNKQIDGCEIDALTDPDNCGPGGTINGGRGAAAGCGVSCSSVNVQTRTCTNGICSGQCAAGFADCDGNKQSDGCETNLLNGDSANCGACGAACSGAHVSAGTCSNGNCIGGCQQGWVDCDGNLRSDGCECDTTVNICANGQCLKQTGQGCTANNQCASGDCCGNLCADESSDISNCGACGHACVYADGNARCTNGSCVLASCFAGAGDCDNNPNDGCETDLTGNVDDCGACNNVCSFPNASAQCSHGTCFPGSCNAGFADCDGNSGNGCEVALTSDPANCDACGHQCNLANAEQGCVNGACTIAACLSGFGDCDNATADGCETALSNDANNCGSCGHSCDDGNPCTTDQCSDGGCTHAPGNQGGACDDGDPCTGSDACNGGTCSGTTLQASIFQDGPFCDGFDLVTTFTVITSGFAHTFTQGDNCAQADNGVMQVTAGQVFTLTKYDYYLCPNGNSWCPGDADNGCSNYEFCSQEMGTDIADNPVSVSVLNEQNDSPANDTCTCGGGSDWYASWDGGQAYPSCP